MLEDIPRDWQIILFKTLWAYRTSKRYSIGVSPYFLTYGHDAMLPMEVVVSSLRILLTIFVLTLLPKTS